MKKAAVTKPKKSNDFFYFAVFISISFVLVFSYIFDKNLNVGGDNASYYILAKSIASGEGYSNIHFPTPVPNTHFPPGYPLILAIFMTIGLNSIVSLKVVTGLFLWGSLLLFFKLLMRLKDNFWLAGFTTFLVLINFHVLSYSTIMMSEMPFLFFTLWGILLFLDLEELPHWWRQPKFYLFVGVLAFSFHLRTIGIALVFGLMAAWLIKKQWTKAAAALGGFVLLSLPWFLRNSAIKGSSYVQQLLMKNPYKPEEGLMQPMDWFTRIWSNLERYVGIEVPVTFFPKIQGIYYGDAVAYYHYLGVPVLVLMVWGWFQVKRHKNIVTAYLLATFSILMLWPEVWFGPRFMLPVFPLMMYLVVLGLKTAIEKIAKKPVHIAWFLPLVLLYLPSLGFLKAMANLETSPEYLTYFKAAEWTKRNTPKDAVIITRKPELFYIYSERACLNYPYIVDHTAFLDSIAAKGGTHVVLEQLGYSSGIRYLYPAIAANMEKFAQLYQTPKPETYVFLFNNKLGYHGEWKIDLPEGEIKDPILGVKHGQGTYVFPDGAFYEGSWKDGARHGYGTMKYPDGSKYEGEWFSNMRQGQGKLINKEGIVAQEGTWKDDAFLGN